MKIVKIVLVLGLLFLAGCQTMNGLGKDLQMVTEPYVAGQN